MKKTILIATRELKERLNSRSFKIMAFVGPIIVLCLIYLLFSIGGSAKKSWNVLISDPNIILDNKILANENNAIKYSFVNDYIEIEDFAKNEKFKDFDALLEINEKILSNKIAFLFYKEKLAEQTTGLIKYQFERRLEEVLVSKFTDLSLEKFRQLKQPINLGIKNAFDPENKASDASAWVGYFFGCIIILFIFMFGMTILRSTSIEKSNRIVEVMLATVNPKQLLLGKIIGIGIAAFLQFVLWILLVSIGLYFMREFLFQDVFDASNLDIQKLTNEVGNFSMQESFMRGNSYNHFVELVYERIQYGSMLFYFVLFFIFAYLFYATFFATLGALTGSESDGQQFVFPLISLLILALYAGFYALQNPADSLTNYFAFIPFTSPIVCLVKIAQGYPDGTIYQLILSIVILIISALIMLYFSSRLYKNGILQFGHRLSLKLIIKWFKRA